MLLKGSEFLRVSCAFGFLSLAVLLICFGLTAKRDVRTNRESLARFSETSKFSGCFKNDVDDHLVDNNTKIVLMVIDAWRLSFLVDSNSPMSFLRSSIISGRGVGFVARVQTPTVTMPRIMVLALSTLKMYARKSNTGLFSVETHGLKQNFRD
ncbi:unnamed protein product [Strongylus vulgaris]|uniref:Uncharacterized protein n=1 Tax=Strongylus vulgaris TaxID=40348 RepID=A0A3P7KJ78_STRVU|nr:unnamed protein product [Strongylus vulgaris]